MNEPFAVKSILEKKKMRKNIEKNRKKINIKIQNVVPF